MEGLHWVHNATGDHYTIVDFAIDENTMTPVVVYRKTGATNSWTRPCSEFFDGRFRPFKPKSMPQRKVSRAELEDRDNIFSDDDHQPVPGTDEIEFTHVTSPVQLERVARRDSVAERP